MFITVDIQNIQHIGLKLFSHVVKIKRKLIEEKYKSSKNKPRYKFEEQSSSSKNGFH